MSEPFIGQIEIFAFGFPPKGWLLCNGQILSIAQNQALFSLLGTTYGGNGTTTFALPDLRSRLPVGFGQSLGGPYYNLGQSTGEEQHTLIGTEMPTHNHFLMADSTTAPASNGGTPSSTAVFGNSAGSSSAGSTFTLQMYSSRTFNNTLAPQVIGLNGGSQPHENRMPYLVLNFCIATSGVFPSRN